MQMTVADLIKELQTYDPELLVVYKKFSEQCLLEPADLDVKALCEPRDDGWVHSYRIDKPTRRYLVLGG